MANVMPFCENWARLLALRSPDEQFRFFQVYLKAAFDGWTPSPSDSAEVQADYWIIEPVVADRAKKSAAGKASAIARKKGVGVQLPVQSGVQLGVQLGVQSPVQPPVPASFKRNEMKGKEMNESADALAHSPSQPVPQPVPSDEPLEAPDESPKNAPSLDDVRAAAHKLNIPDDFAEYFQCEMEKLDWKAMKPSGAVYPVTRLNVAQTLRNWWHKNEEQKKERAAREAEATAAAVPMNGAGRAAVEAWTGGVEE